MTFSPVYKHYQETIRENQIQRAIKRIEKSGKVTHKNANDIKRFIREVHMTKEGEVAEKTNYVLNETQIEKEKMYDGFYAVSTNLDGDIGEIIAVNKRRWQIEASFRIMKTELKTRPFYLQDEDRIKAHFLSCFIALLVTSILEKKLNDVSCTQILDTLRNMHVVKQDEYSYILAYERTDLTDALHNALGFRTDYELFDQKMIKRLKNFSNNPKTLK